MTHQPGAGVGTTAPVPDEPGREPHERRLERLEQRVAELARSVEAGLVAQARRVESVVGTTRRELVEAMGDHSDLVEATTRAVREVLAGAAPTSVDPAASVADDTDVVADLRDELQQDRLTLREGLRRDVEDLRSRLSEDVDGLREQVQTLVEQAVHRPAAGPGEKEEMADRVRHLVDEVAGGLAAAERRLGDTLDSLREVQESLVTHLVERDRQIALERAHLTRAFVEELAGALSRRDRRRVARKLDVDRVATSDGWDHTEDVTRSADPVPANVPVVRPASDPSSPTTGDQPEPGAAPDVPPDDGPDVPPGEELDVPPEDEADEDDRQRVQPSLGTRPVHPRASAPRDPAAMRRPLAGVRGLGPARQAALISAFGSLDELREATDDELLAVRGIGPSLLEPIRSVL